MAPITENIHDLVAKLEQRVKDLEERLHLASGGAPKAINTADGIRMILMGPPGAGTETNTPDWHNMECLGTGANL